MSSRTPVEYHWFILLHSHHHQMSANNYVPVIHFKHQEAILRYLDKSGTLVTLQEAANKYKKYTKRLQKDGEHRVPFLFLVELDIVLLSEISGK
jgi:hypothetical protein